MPQNMSPARLKALAEAATMWAGVFRGDRRVTLDVAEALSTSDFQQATGDVLHRELLARYADIPQVWSRFTRRGTVTDFKPKTFVDLMGGKAALDRVPELSEYPARDVTKGEYQLQVGKYGGRFAISFEAIINDELGELRDLPANLAQAARDTEDRTATELIASKSGPNTGFFKAGNGNAVDDAPLTTDNLDAAIGAISTRKDTDGRPVRVTGGFVLVVPPGLESTARKILAATEIRQTDADGNVVVQANYLRDRVELVVNDWLPVIDTSATSATTWYVLPKPTAARPALIVAFLRGHEAPDLRVKADTGNRVGGGSIAPEDGSFDIDDVQYRCRHILGGAQLDPAGTYASKGNAA